MALKVLIVTEYYPRAGDPARGVWAHRQALATRQAGAEVRVLVLHRPLPPLAAIRRGDLRAIRSELAQPGRAQIDGIEVEYLRYVSPPRPWSYASWGAWAAPLLARRLRSVAQQFAFDLIHAHYAVPSGDAVRRAAADVPMVVSVHGHDVHGPGPRMSTVGPTLAHARLVLVNSAGTARRCAACGARRTRIVHLGTDVPDTPTTAPRVPTLVTVANLVARKRHADVIDALALLRERHGELRYVIAGDGPERDRLRAHADRVGLGGAVELRGAMPHEAAVRTAQSATVFVMPSTDEAFGVAYIEAMAAGVPAIGCEHEDGPAEIAAAGGGIALVPPRDPGALARTIERLLEPGAHDALAAQARENVLRSFTWEQCGRETVMAYEDALAA